jgi:hypothetical protein
MTPGALSLSDLLTSELILTQVTAPGKELLKMVRVLGESDTLSLEEETSHVLELIAKIKHTAKIKKNKFKAKGGGAGKTRKDGGGGVDEINVADSVSMRVNHFNNSLFHSFRCDCRHDTSCKSVHPPYS